VSRSLREARDQAEAQEQRIASLSQTIEGLRQELMTAEDASEKKSTEIKRLQQQQQQHTGQPQAVAGPSMDAVRETFILLPSDSLNLPLSCHVR
jgi:septal ring factor EnvC (AmiA/AmiB activator)